SLLQKRREDMEVHKAMKRQREVKHISNISRNLAQSSSCMIVSLYILFGFQDFESTLRALRIHKNELIEKFEDTKALIKERDCLGKRVQKNAIYPHYLDKVVQDLRSIQFQEARQVMSRYGTLMLTQEDLVPTTQQNQDSTEKARLQSQLDKAHAEGIIWESRWAHIQNTAAKKTLLLCTIKMATINLYQSVCKRAKDTGDLPVAPEDPPKQLEKVP
uniref:Uncharacterized protein n=1 Tax=Salmo trutta TaxID=8032 RepID=A0A674BQV0_SALTR